MTKPSQLLSPPPGPPPGFCASPWLEAVLRIDGSVHTCCRNSEILGNIGNVPLNKVWLNSGYRSFRQHVASGRYPNSECERCHLSGQSTTVSRHLKPLATDLLEQIRSDHGHWGLWRKSLFARASRWFLQTLDSPQRHPWATRISGAMLRNISALLRFTNPTQALDKLIVATEVASDYASLTLNPRHVAPVRQPQLVATCNLRCRSCIGRFTGEIERGIEIDGKWHKRMSRPLTLASMQQGSSLLDFFMNGTELFLHPNWKELAKGLQASGVKFRLSTNGMLLTRSTVDFLLAGQFLSHLNISLDGAKTKTIEDLRTGVQAKLLMKHLQYLFSVAIRHSKPPKISCSYLLMASNLDELPALPGLLKTLRGDSALPIQISVQYLNPAPVTAYQQFVKAHGLSKIDRATIVRTLEKAQDNARACGIALSLPIEELPALLG